MAGSSSADCDSSRSIGPRSTLAPCPHVHIDQHHGGMGIEGLCVSLIERIGESIIPKIVRGFEDGQHHSRMYRADLCTHLDWVDSLWSQAVVDDEEVSEDSAEFFTTVIDTPRELSVTAGTVRIYLMPWDIMNNIRTPIMHARLRLAGLYSSAARSRTTPAPRRVSRLGTSSGRLPTILEEAKRLHPALSAPRSSKKKEMEAWTEIFRRRPTRRERRSAWPISVVAP
jgi:hypothetical protein